MKQPRPVTIDFETVGIEGRPSYPPVPVGVSIKQWGKPSRYYSWGHPTKNNCLPSEGLAALKAVWDNPDGLLMHNSKFDLDVADVHLGLPVPGWDRIHDTMLMLFLDDPNQRRVDLKGAAERMLSMPPEERDIVAEWLIKNQPIPFVRINNAKSGKAPVGKYIAYAPGDIVGDYAKGDTERTAALFGHIWPTLKKRRMLAAYERERKLVPILLDMERRGVRVDLEALRTDVASYGALFEKLDAWIRKQLNTPDLNIDSDTALVKALIAVNKVNESELGVTPAGQYKADKAAFEVAVTDRRLGAVLRYRGALATCLKTFMRPWLETAEGSDGIIYTTWHAIKADGAGARTGRFSSSPNLQNIPKRFKPLFHHEKAGLPKAPFDLPSLPLVRGYIVPYEGHVLIGRDFASQELRVLAHYEDGPMKEGYLENPTLDLHQFAADLITEKTGLPITRDASKAVGFAILYGAGIGKLAQTLGCGVDEAKKLKAEYLRAFPGVKLLQDDLKARSKAGLPAYTLGGREFFCEEPVMINGHKQTFEYRLLNYAIQGSSADLTKDSMIRFVSKKTAGALLASVHDELLVSAPIAVADKVMRALQESMNDAGLDVPMLSDGERGYNWARMEACS